MSEGGISRESETLEVFYGLHQPAGGETHRTFQVRNVFKKGRNVGQLTMK